MFDYSEVFVPFENFSLLVRDYKFLPKVGTRDHKAVKVLQRVAHAVTRDIRLYGLLLGPVTLALI